MPVGRHAAPLPDEDGQAGHPLPVEDEVTGQVGGQHAQVGRQKFDRNEDLKALLASDVDHGRGGDAAVCGGGGDAAVGWLRACKEEHGPHHHHGQQNPPPQPLILLAADPAIVEHKEQADRVNSDHNPLHAGKRKKDGQPQADGHRAGHGPTDSLDADHEAHQCKEEVVGVDEGRVEVGDNVDARGGQVADKGRHRPGHQVGEGQVDQRQQEGQRVR